MQYQYNLIIYSLFDHPLPPPKIPMCVTAHMHIPVHNPLALAPLCDSSMHDTDN